MLAHQSQRNHDLSPHKAIRPGRRDRLAAAAGVAGVIVVAALGVFLSLMGSQSPEPKKGPENDQESGLSDQSSVPSPSPSPPPTLASTTPPVSWPSYPTSDDDQAAGDGDDPDPDSGPPPENGPTPEKDLTPKEIEARPKPVPSPSPGVGEALPPPRRDSPTPSGPPERSRAPRPLPTPRKPTEPPPDAPAAQATEPDDHSERHEPPIPLRTDPCATFLDFRRDYCYRVLDRLGR